MKIFLYIYIYIYKKIAVAKKWNMARKQASSSMVLKSTGFLEKAMDC